ncbi:MAG: hypothetical protein M3Y28_05870, partial [Armatimonadota bacterium]|nr:hypothetical protein [Armatimonadota bacterium]
MTNPAFRDTLRAVTPDRPETLSPHSTRKARPWQEPTRVGAFLLLLTLIYFWPQLVRGRVLYWGDIGLYFTPMQQFLHTQLQAGRFPLWNPLILCGAPYVGNPQTWPLYPLSALLAVLPAPQFINVTVAFHVFLAALGTYYFLRRALGLSVVPSLFGAVTFGFGGQFASKEQFPNMVQAAAYLPWVLLAVRGLAQNVNVRAALWLGTALGLQLLAAHAQMTLLTLYLGAAYGASLLVTHKRFGLPTLGRLAGLTALAGCVAFGLAAGQLLPTLELSHAAWRQRLSFAIVNRFYLPDTQLLNFVLPTLHGHPMDGNFTARGNFWETCCYIGMFPFVLALAGSVLAWRRPETFRAGRFWTVVFIIGLLLALGGQTWRGNPASHGLYKLVFLFLPGFRVFHDPARCLLWACFALSVLAALGMNHWARRLGRAELACALIVLLAFADLAYFGRTIYPLTDAARALPPPPLVARLQSDPLLASRQARYLAPDTARTWQRFTSKRAYRQNAPDYLPLWVGTLTPNLMMPAGLPNAYGYEPVTRRDTQAITGTANDLFAPDQTPERRAQAAVWAGMLGVAYVATLRETRPEAVLPGLIPMLAAPTLPSLRPTDGGPARVFLSRNQRWQFRARLMTNFVQADTPTQALKRMADSLDPEKQSDLNLAHTVVVVGPIPFPSSAPVKRAALITEDTPDRVTVAADAPRPALLVLADTLHPGWTATLDGHPTPLLSADGCLRAVALPQAGPHTVVFSY